jgi:transposase-like protein
MAGNGVRHTESKKINARQLRTAGYSYKRIARRLGISSGTAFLWTKPIDIDPTIRIRGARRAARAGGLARRRDALKRHEQWKQQAESEWKGLSSDPLFMIGLGIYWGEGGKSWTASFTNSDVGPHRLWQRWRRKFFPGVKVHWQVNIHNKERATPAVRFWRKKLAIPEAEKISPIIAVSSASRRKRPKRCLPCGTLKQSIGTGGTEMLVKILSWLNPLQTFQAINDIPTTTGG